MCPRHGILRIEIVSPDLLQGSWGLAGASIEPLGGGINSETWLVRHRGSTYVAKRVAPGGLDDLVAGCEVAESLAAAGFTKSDC